MRVVLDTNVLLVAISLRSAYAPIFKEFLNGAFQLCISNEILSEYSEILTQKLGESSASEIIKILLNSPDLIKVEPTYKWDLITVDPDDKHFQVLKSIDWPKVDVLSAIEFMTELSN